MFAWKRPKIRNSLTEFINQYKETLTVREVLGNGDLSVCVRNAVPELIDLFVPDPEACTNEEAALAKNRFEELCRWAFTNELYTEPGDFRHSRNASNLLSSVVNGMLSKFATAGSPLINWLQKFLDTKYSEDTELCGHFQRCVEAVARDTKGAVFDLWCDDKAELYRKLLQHVSKLPIRELCGALLTDYHESLWSDPLIPFMDILDVALQNTKKISQKVNSNHVPHSSNPRPVRMRDDRIKQKRKVKDNDTKASIRWKKNREDYEQTAYCALTIIKGVWENMDDELLKAARHPNVFDKLFQIGEICPEHSVTLLNVIWNLATDLLYLKKTISESVYDVIASHTPQITEMSEEWWLKRKDSPTPYRCDRLLYQFQIWPGHLMCAMHRCLFVEPAVSDRFGYFFVKNFKSISDKDRKTVMEYDNDSLLKGIMKHVQTPSTDEEYLNSTEPVRAEVNGFLVELALIITDTEKNKAVTEFMLSEEWTKWVIDVLIFYVRARYAEVDGSSARRFTCAEEEEEQIESDDWMTTTTARKF